jgi:hypothetical protein
MNDKEIEPQGAGEDHADAELHAMLAASDERLLNAIRRSLDLDGGLAQIVGDPPRREISPQGSAAGATPPDMESAPYADWLMVHNASDVSCRISVLRFDILDLRCSAGRIDLCETSAALLSGAASNLKDLNRGLEARELTRYDAISLLDQVDLSLEKAFDTQKLTSLQASRMPALEHIDNLRGVEHREKRASWLRWMLCAPSWLVVLAIVIPPLLTAVVALATSVWAGRSVLVIIPIVSAIVFVLTVIAGPLVAAQITHRRAAEARTGNARLTRADLDQVRAAATERRATARGFLRRTHEKYLGQPAHEPTRQAIDGLGATYRRLRPYNPTIKIRTLRGELSQVRPDVVRLFDEAGDCSPRCTPHLPC